MSNNENIAGKANPRRNPGGAPVSIIHQKIEIRPFNRSQLDINIWRSALKSAEGLIRYRVKLYDIYRELIDDGHVEAVWGKRKAAVTTANFQFVNKDGEPVDSINQLVDSIGFEDTLNEIIDSRGWGYSMMEPGFYKNSDGDWEMSLYVVPKYLMRPELGIIAKNAYSDDGINIREGIYAKTIMEVGKPDDVGLFNKAVPYYIFKRGGFGDFAMYVQVFGQPLVDAEWDGVDEKQRIALSEALNSIGSGGAIVRPAGTKVQLIDKSAAANGDLQDKFLAACNKEISKALLGSTETTEASKSSGYAQSKTHEGQDDRKHESDIKFARRILNSRFIPILKAAGFDTQGGRFIIQGEEDSLTKKESFEIHKGLKKEMSLPMDDDFLYETYGVPKPDNYDELKDQQSAEPEPPDDQAGGKGKKKGKEGLPSKGGNGNKADEEKEVKLRDDGQSLVKQVQESVRQALEKMKSFFVEALPGMTGRASRMTNLSGSHACGEILTLSEKDKRDINAIAKAVQKADGKGLIYPEMFNYTAGVLCKGFKMGWDGKELVKLSLGFTYGVDDPATLTTYEQNIFRFSGIESAYEAAQVNKLFRESKSFEEFERSVRKLLGGQNLNHLRAEYNTAHAIGESAANYKRLLGIMDTFPYWEYRTVMDDRVRETHRELHGIILPANHPLWKKIFPPNDWQCRCYVVPRLEGEVDPKIVQANIAFVNDYVTSPYWEKVTNQGFGINRGDDEVVFTEAQMYSTNPDGVMQKINSMTAKDWTLLAIVDKELKSLPPAPKPVPYTGTLKDYAGRHIISKGQDWVNDVISKPDEVWINGNTWTYIRYYKNDPIHVEAYLDADGTLEVISSGVATEANRTGLLIL